MTRQSWTVRLLLGAVGLVFVSTVVWLSLKYSLGIDLGLPDGGGHEEGADDGDREARGEQHRVHQTSSFTMRMIIPIPIATDTAAPMRANSPGVCSMGSR